MSPPFLKHLEALGSTSLPAAYVDLDAFDRNVDRIPLVLAAAERDVPREIPLKVRIGTKSLRCENLLQRARERLGQRFGGLLTYTARESLALIDKGFDDIVLAYPTVESDDARMIAEANLRPGRRVTAMIDHPDHLDVLATAAERLRATIPVALDVDMAWYPPFGGRSYGIGVRRSPLDRVEAVVSLAQQVAETPGLSFAGVMGYEAQIAGLPDRTRDGGRSLLHAFIKWLSRGAVKALRAEVVQGLASVSLPALFVNGGGTGSLAFTARDPSVSEVTLGSGLLGPHLFDGMDEFKSEPALFFALRVTRVPDRNVVTCAGGGYVASGPAGEDRLPVPVYPQRAKLLAWEGAGEVQTPVKLPSAVTLAVGDAVVFRHGKGGELAERFPSYHLVRGDVHVTEVLTYRGAGLTWG